MRFENFLVFIWFEYRVRGSLSQRGGARVFYTFIIRDNTARGHIGGEIIKTDSPRLRARDNYSPRLSSPRRYIILLNIRPAVFAVGRPRKTNLYSLFFSPPRRPSHRRRRRRPVFFFV